MPQSMPIYCAASTIFNDPIPSFLSKISFHNSFLSLLDYKFLWIIPMSIQAHCFISPPKIKQKILVAPHVSLAPYLFF